MASWVTSQEREGSIRLSQRGSVRVAVKDSQKPATKELTYLSTTGFKGDCFSIGGLKTKSQPCLAS